MSGTTNVDLTVDLPEALVSELSAEAARLHLPLSEYVVRVLSLLPVTGATPRTGAEVVAYWQNEGLVGTRAEIADSQQHARELRNRAEGRQQGEAMYLLDTDVLGIAPQRGALQ